MLAYAHLFSLLLRSRLGNQKHHVRDIIIILDMESLLSDLTADIKHSGSRSFL